MGGGTIIDNLDIWHSLFFIVYPEFRDRLLSGFMDVKKKKL